MRVDGGERGFVVARAVEQRDAAGVRDLEQHARPAFGGQRGERVGDGRGEVVVEHERDRVGVVEQERELGADVAVVDVDRNAPELLRAEEGLQVLGRVDAHDRDLVVGLDARVAQHVGEPLGPVVELAEA